MKKFLYITIILIACSKPEFKETVFNAKVIKVTDGDTIRVIDDNRKIFKIRLLGIDAPENTEKRFGYKEFFGDEAKEFLNKLILNKIIKIVTYKNHRGKMFQDKYKRVLAYIYLGETDINAFLVKSGYAKVYRKMHNFPRLAEFSEYENHARNNKLGLWKK